MPDYSKGKIYKLVADETDKVYVGSTTQTLSARMRGHRKDTKHEKVTSHELLKYPSCRIELLEEYPCESRKELNIKEGEWIRRLPCVNRCVAGRTRAESSRACYDSHIEARKAYTNAYYQANRDRLLANMKVRRTKVKQSSEPLQPEPMPYPWVSHS